METTTTHHKAPKRRLEEQGSASAPVDMEQEQPPTLAPPTRVPAEHPCTIPGCDLAFGSAARLEVHFKAAHQFACADCHRAFSSSAILDRHIEEHHDPFFQVLMDRGEKPYRCLAECGASFGSGNARKLHCIAKHNFPRNFDFEGLLGAVAAPPSSRAARGGGGKDDGGKRRQKQPLTEEERAAREEAIKASGAVCRYYYTPGGCRRGKACFFRHDAEGEGEGEGEGSEVDVDRLGEALDRRLKLEHARSVSFGRQARGRSKRLGRALPPQGGGGGEG